MRHLTYLQQVMGLTLAPLILATSQTAGYHRLGRAAEARTTGASNANAPWSIETIQPTPHPAACGAECNVVSD
ncbi:MAG: hypothetical protein PVG71_00645, partial [Anaerolineae bacterium]